MKKSFFSSQSLITKSAQAGISVSSKSAGKSMEGNPRLTEPQEYMKTGEPLPIIFCRRRTIGAADTGGVMALPKATEGRFSNDMRRKRTRNTDNTASVFSLEEEVSIGYIFVLCEGEIGNLQVRDMHYGPGRSGRWQQSFNGRAPARFGGQTVDWTPNNRIDDFLYKLTEDSSGDFEHPSNPVSSRYYLAGGTIYNYPNGDTSLIVSKPHKERIFPQFTGTSGSYSGLTTLGLSIFFVNREQVDMTANVFVREGLRVIRLVDNTLGSSDNYVDLAKYLLTQNNRLPAELIDSASLVAAANFTNANNLLFNGVIAESNNLMDWLQKTSEHFLLRLSNSGGKFGLIPRLPFNADYTFKVTKIDPAFTFTEEHVTVDGFEIEYVSIEDREPVCFNISWRQQAEASFGIVRTLKVNYQNEAANGPFIDIDLSGYCTNESHAARYGAFKLAQRKFIAHHLRLTVREYSYNSTLVVGSLVRVKLRRETSDKTVSAHDKIYEINRIERTFEGEIVYDLTHFPINSQGQSIIAIAVNSAQGQGNIISVGEGDYNPDTNSSTDTTEVEQSPSPLGTEPSTQDTEVELPQPADVDEVYPDPSNNPVDTVDEMPLTGATSGGPFPGDTLSHVPSGAGGITSWTANGVSTATGSTLTIDPSHIGSNIQGTTSFAGGEILSNVLSVPSYSSTGEAISGDTNGTAAAGDTLSFALSSCPNAEIVWFKKDVNSGDFTKLSAGVGQTLTITEAMTQEGLRVLAVARCSDNSNSLHESEVIDLFDEIDDCPGGGDSGGQGTFTRLIDVGTAFPASFNFRYTAYNVPDRFVISGAASLDTGYVGGINVNVTVQKTSSGRYITVTVYAPLSGTLWNYDVGCAS